jgi:hypothetical protein
MNEIVFKINSNSNSNSKVYSKGKGTISVILAKNHLLVMYKKTRQYKKKDNTRPNYQQEN